MRLIRLLKRDLAREASTWADEGIITREQAESICAHYGIDFQEHVGRSQGYHLLVALGYLFIGLSLITLVGANWEEIPRTLRMAGLILVTLGFNLLGLRRFHRGGDRAAVGFFFLGGLCYGASIMLIAQIYHIGEHFPDGILWWALGILPLALLLKSTLLMTLTTALAFAWFFVETGLQYYPAFFFLFMAALAWHVLRLRQSNLLFLSLVVGLGTLAEYSISWHLMGEKHRFDFHPENVALVMALFLLFYGLSQWMSQRPEHRLKDYGLLLEVWALRFVVVSLLVFSFEEPWKELTGANWTEPGLILALSLGLAAGAVGLTLSAGRGVLPTAAFSLYCLVSLLAVTRADPYDEVTFQVVDNVALVVTGVWLILSGIRRGMSHFFILGMAAVMGAALLRYIDLVGDYLGAALLFALFAAILLATARYWKHHLAGTEEPR